MDDDFLREVLGDRNKKPGAVATPDIAAAGPSLHEGSESRSGVSGALGAPAGTVLVDPRPSASRMGAGGGDEATARGGRGDAAAAAQACTPTCAAGPTGDGPSGSLPPAPERELGGGLRGSFLTHEREAAAAAARMSAVSVEDEDEEEDISPHALALARDRAEAAALVHGGSFVDAGGAAAGGAGGGGGGRELGNAESEPAALGGHERRKSWGELFLSGMLNRGYSSKTVSPTAAKGIPARRSEGSSEGLDRTSGGGGEEGDGQPLSSSAPTVSLLEGSTERDVDGNRVEGDQDQLSGGWGQGASGSMGKLGGGNFTRTTSSFVLDAEANPMPQSIPPPVFGDQGNIGEKHVLVMVGLPARGKTHMAKRLCQYLRFFHGARTQVFNVGSYRRKMMPKKADANFFNNQNEENERLRMSFARAALKDMIDFLFQEDNASHLEQRGFDSGRVAIFDATNTTRERREWIRAQLDGLPLKLLFVESVCTDDVIVDRNIWQAKVNNEDYLNDADKLKAYEDFKLRIRQYEEVYEPLEEEHLSFIKLINCGRRVEINNIHGFLLGRIVQFLTNLHATHQTIYLSRHGQSEYNYQGKIGGDSGLSTMGEAYAKRLGEYCEKTLCVDPESGAQVPCRLWTSSLRRTILTARHIPHPKIKKHPTPGRFSQSRPTDWIQMSPRELRNLDEIYAGVCDGMTYEEIEANYPEEYALRQENKLGYRYPRGESYLDVISRLDPLIQELESYEEPVLIVGHQGVLRLIYSYFMGLDRSDACTASIPLNTVIKLTPRTHVCDEERVVLYEPSKEDLGVVTEVEGEDNMNNLGGGVSPTAAAASLAAQRPNPFASNIEPPSY